MMDNGMGGENAMFWVESSSKGIIIVPLDHVLFPMDASSEKNKRKAGRTHTPPSIYRMFTHVSKAVQVTIGKGHETDRQTDEQSERERKKERRSRRGEEGNMRK
jgi:hypothetical protein